MSKTAFNTLIDNVTPISAEQYQASLTHDWLQGRTAFGGILSALGVAALRQALDSQRPLRALMTSFIGPASAGELTIDCDHLRSGRSATWAQAKISQQGKVCTTLSACFGDERQSAIEVTPERRPQAVGPQDSLPFPFIDGVTPNFIQHFDMRWAIGKPPMSGSTESQMGAWIRFRDPSEFSEFNIVTLMDLLPPAVMQMFTEMKPVSSLSWHLEMLDDLSSPDALDATGWWFFHVYAQGAAHGYSQQHATLYAPSGRAIAMSQQTIAVFA